MNKGDRAKQFAPFDALKGLQDALRIKEYEHERIMKGDIDEDEVKKISGLLLDTKKNQNVYVRYFKDGHYFEISGSVLIEYTDRVLRIDNEFISFDNIFDYKIL